MFESFNRLCSRFKVCQSRTISDRTKKLMKKGSTTNIELRSNLLSLSFEGYFFHFFFKEGHSFNDVEKKTTLQGLNSFKSTSVYL